MALPLSGIITSAMILTELRFTGSGNILYNIIRKPSGILQVKVNNDWVNLNMCSPYLPSEIPTYIVASDWYGYDHGTTGVETIAISGDTTIDVGQTVTYTATLTGDNLAGVILTWYKFEIDSWSPSLGTGTTKAITWTDPRGAKVKVVASNICNLNTVEKVIDITYNCTVITGDPYVGGTYAVNESFDIYIVNANPDIVGHPNNTRLGITYFWEVTGSVSIISGQGTNKLTVRPTAVSSNLNVRVTIGSCGGSHISGYITFSSANPITVYYNDAQSRSIQKQCPSGQIGSYVTVTRAAGTHSSTVSVADANTQANSWLYGQEAQNIANASGNCGSTPTYPNNYRSGTYTRNNCSVGTGTQITTVVPEGTYYAESVSAANTLAENHITTNGQTNANNQGQCLTCTNTLYGLGITYTIGTGTIQVNVTYGANQAGADTVAITFSNGTTNFYITQGVTSVVGTNSVTLNLSCNGTGTLTVSVANFCDNKVTSVSGITITGATVCTNGLIEAGSTRSYYGGGVYTIAMDFSDNTNIRNVGGYIELRHVVVGTVAQTDYFSGLDFSSNITQYLSFGISSGQNWNVFYRVVITSGTNLCDTTQEWLSSSSIQIVNPY